MMSSFLAYVLLAQVGPFATTPKPPRPPVEGRENSTRRTPAKPFAKVPAGPPPPSRLERCLIQADSAPQSAMASANSWLAQATGTAKAMPLHCLGTAQGNLGQWPAAEKSFIAARDASAPTDSALRAILGGMAGDAALESRAPDRALALFDSAIADARKADDLALVGELSTDKARTLVALRREDEAGKALIEARTSAPDSPLAWLLSATLSRRQGKLQQAQGQIATAAGLNPKDPEIALEAGVIAALRGDDAAAQRHWQTVIKLAPGTGIATTAQDYLKQLATPMKAPALPAP